MAVTMLEVAQVIAVVSAGLLVLATAAWLKLARTPELQLLDGSKEIDASAPVEVASRLIVLAASLSAVASILAVTGWFAS